MFEIELIIWIKMDLALNNLQPPQKKPPNHILQQKQMKLIFLQKNSGSFDDYVHFITLSFIMVCSICLNQMSLIFWFASKSHSSRLPFVTYEHNNLWISISNGNITDLDLYMHTNHIVKNKTKPTHIHTKLHKLFASGKWKWSQMVSKVLL